MKINAHHLYRVNHHALEIEKRKTIDLKDEQNQLLIQESSKSGNGRISEYAKSKLKMNPPENKQKRIIK